MSDLNKMTDEELVANGTPQAVNILLSRYKNMIIAKSRNIFFLGADLEDVIQEGMIGLAHAIANYNAQTNARFSTFAETCVIHQMLDSVRRYAAQKHAPLNTALPLEKQAEDLDDSNSEMATYVEISEPGPEDLYIEKEAIAEAKANIIKKLTPFETQVFELYTEGFSYAEIANKTGRTAKSVDNAIRRIKDKAKQ